MKTDGFMQKLIHGIASCLLVALPTTGWSAEISDRPLFIEANLDHNLMFAVDDSGSMDFEILAPEVGDEDAIIDGYIFNPGTENGSYTYGTADYETGKLLIGDYLFQSFTPRNYYLRAPAYNFQYYDPSVDYEPWPSTATRQFSNSSITNAELDPGLSNTDSYDLTEKDKLGVGDDNYPATVFVVNEDLTLYTREIERNYGSCPSGQVVNPDDSSECGILETVRVCGLFYCWNETAFSYRQDRPVDSSVITDTEVVDCSADDAANYYDTWRANPDQFFYKTDEGAELESRKVGLAPDGTCLQRLELVDEGSNAEEVLAATGDSLADQQQNFANWFSYYRRRHHAIRAAIGQSVQGLENMRLGVFWINSRRDMSSAIYDSDTDLNSFLDDHYGRFDSGSWSGGGTPNRAGLQHAGRELSKQSVRGDLECRKNFTLLFTDGYSNELNDVAIDAGNADKDADAPFGNDDHSNALGDIAYFYYQGLRNSDKTTISGGDVRIPANCSNSDVGAWVDCNTEHHMNTYTVSLGMVGENYAGLDYFSVMDAHDNPPDWGDSAIGTASSTGQIDDLYHAAVNGKGEYYSAKSTKELVDALQSAVDDTKTEAGSGSNLNFDSASLKEGGVVYSAQFTSRQWTGDLIAENINESGDITGTKWRANEQLINRDLSSSPRLILTMGDAGDGPEGVEFAWDNLTADQKADLGSGGGSDAVALGKERLKYLSGEDIEGYDGTVFRNRTFDGERWLMGPIVNSSPQYVGIPGKNWPNTYPFGAEGKRYSAFRDNKENRDAVVYVGANDGMLHGFDAETGNEVLAYIPSFLFSDEPGEGLHALTQSSYDYQSYVDLPVAVSDIYTDDEWKTILIGGARGNGPGLFALDVTDPSTFSSANAADTVLWEFTPDDDANMGHQISEVQITMLDWGSGDYRWSAVFENGYGASTGRNGLFILDLSKSQGTAWQEGVNYEFIDLAAGDGLSPVRLVDHVDTAGNPGSDGIADRAYAGDTSGRLWAIDLSGGSTWGSAYSSQPLFTATDSSGVVQPITVRPVVARNSYQTSLADPNLIVMFGTGRYLSYGDISDQQEQSFYGVNDRGVSALSRAADNLMERELYEQQLSASDSTVVRKTDNEALDWTTKYGWFVDFDTQAGERVVSSPGVEGDYVVFPTNIPVADDPCGGGGSSFIMALEIDGSTDPAKSIIDVNNDGQLDGVDAGWSGVYFGTLITGTKRIDDWLFGAGSDGSKEKVKTDFGSNNMDARRASWREVIPE